MKWFIALLLCMFFVHYVLAQEATGSGGDGFNDLRNERLAADARRVHRYLDPDTAENVPDGVIVYISSAKASYVLNEISILRKLEQGADGRWRLTEKSAFLDNFDQADAGQGDDEIASERGWCSDNERIVSREEIAQLFASFAPDWPDQTTGDKGWCAHCSSIHLLVGRPYGRAEHHYKSLPVAFEGPSPEQMKTNERNRLEAEAKGERLWVLDILGPPIPNVDGSIPQFIGRIESLGSELSRDTCAMPLGTGAQIIEPDSQIETEYQQAILEIEAAYAQEQSNQETLPK